MATMQPGQAYGTIHIESHPRTSELLADLFRQMQLAGLFVAHFGTGRREPDGEFAQRFGLRPALLHSIFMAAEGALPGGVRVSGVPGIYNRAQWSSAGSLGGYAGRDLTVKASDLVASYLGCWQQAAEFPDTAAFRFIRLGFWYWRERGDALAALGLLLDLYQAGFFLQQQHFADAALNLCGAYTRDFDMASLKGVDFEDEGAGGAFARAFQELSQRPHSGPKAQEVVEWVADRAIEESDRLRNASTPDEWVAGQAGLHATVGLLHSLDRQHGELLTGMQRAIASQFEEIRADLGGEAAATHMMASAGHPLRLKMLGVLGVGMEYQRTYGADWLGKMLEDRVLAPNALRGTVEAAYRGVELPAVRYFAVPPGWRMVSEAVAWPLCAAFEKDPMLERSDEFDDQAVARRCADLGYTPQDGWPGAAADAFSPEAQARARRGLSVEYLAAFFDDETLFAGAKPAETMARIAEAAALYPWNHLLRRELGIRNDQSGNPAEGHRQMRAAVLLEPTDGMNWHSLSVVLGRMGEDRDAVFAAAISRMIQQRDSK